MLSYQEIIKKVEPEMEEALNFLKSELAKIRTSRVSPALIENLKVELFGQTMILKQLANITITGPRELTIFPWDASYIESIEKALRKESLGSVTVEGNNIRLSLPVLSQEYREEMIKKVKEIGERVKQTIRKWRQKAWDEIQEKTRTGEIREDDKYRGKEELQKLVDKFNQEVEKLIEQKIKELKE